MTIIRKTLRSEVSEPASEGWESLMAAAQRGDQAAYDRVLREILPLLRAVARRCCRNPADVEDAVQDALITIHTLRHTYDPSRPLRPWLAVLCERRCIDRMRWHRRHAGAETPLAESAEDIAAPGTADAAEREVVRQEVRAMVNTLPRSQRIALTLTGLRGLPLADASAHSGISANALKVAAFRGVRSLREKLAVSAAA